MSAFVDVLHRVATIGEQVVEHVAGNTHITLNGAVVTAEEVVRLIQALQEVETALAAAGV